MMSSKNQLIVNVLIKHVKTIPKLYKSFDFSNIHQRYSLADYLIEILYVLKTGIAWRDLRCPMNWISVYKVYTKLVSYNIFKISYTTLLNKYIKRAPNKKLRYISTDTSFISNK